ncbi:MAG TPA: tRNA adenylyltransferase, partial [Firmicutes bacterium]|nr:tRNA adenylyltransferase [Bacillota bacterium]
KRIQEDPLRICRAERFARLLDFKLDAKTEEAIQRNRYLLKEIKPAKLDEEERKGWNRK